MRTCPTCGLQVTPESTVCPRDGTQLSVGINQDPAFLNYEMLGIIGQGGMGVIYKARHLVLNKLVAIKTIHSNLYTPEIVQRFQIEGRAASSLSHPNIVSVHDFGVTQFGQPYMIMEYVNGRTLADLLRSEGALSSKRFVEIFSQVCSGLALAHRKSIVHRDLKPGNIMLVSEDQGEEQVRIMDFGIAKIMTDENAATPSLTKTGETIGSPLYMSPEQARSLKTDFRSDLYSLGCVMYECLTGSPPFAGQTFMETLLMHMEKMPPPMKEASLGREIDPRLEKIVMRLLAKEPEKRYLSMDDLLDAITNYKQIPLGDPNDSNQRIDNQNNWKRPLKVLLVSLVVIVLVGIVAGYLLVARREKPPAAVPAPSDTTQVSAGALTKPSNPTPMTEEIRQRFITHPHDDELHLNNNSGLFPVKDSDLVAVEGADQLRRIEISYSDVTDKGLEHMSNLKNLDHLDLPANPKIKDLHALKSLTNLENINVAGTNVNHEGMAVLAALPSLEYLDLSDTDLSDADLKLLAKSKKLRHVELLRVGGVTDKAVAQLKAKLPSCTFTLEKSSVDATIRAARQRAWRDFISQKYAEADNDLTEVESIVNSNPDLTPDTMTDYYSLKGDTKLQLKDFDGAISALSRALETLELNGNREKNAAKIVIVANKLAGCGEVLSAKDSGKRKISSSARETAELGYQQLLKENPSEVNFRRDRVANLRILNFDYGATGECDLALKNEKLELQLSDTYHVPADGLTRDYNLLIGACLQAEKRYSEAISHYLASLDVIEKHPELKEMSRVVSLKLKVAECAIALDNKDSRPQAECVLKEVLAEPRGVLPAEKIQALGALIPLLERMKKDSEAAPYKQLLQQLVQQSSKK
jgi:serine/threonine protein kinase